MVLRFQWGSQTMARQSLRSHMNSTQMILERWRKMQGAKKLMYFGLGPNEYTRISECESAKEIWNPLRVAYEGTNQVKQSRIELLMRKYELFEMSNKETMMDMYTRFTPIINELKSPGKSCTIEELVRKILRFFLNCGK